MIEHAHVGAARTTGCASWSRVVLSLVILPALARADTAPPAPASYADPFVYCAAVQNIDAPDGRYTGPAVPPVIAEGLKRAFDAPTDAPLEVFTRGTSWRCMNGKVYACNVGANLPCDAKADTKREAAQAVREFCKSQPNADVIPAVVTGRETIYEWKCRGDKAVITREVAQADARGFLANVWYEIRPPGSH